MAAIDWTTTQTNLDAAISTADGPDLDLLVDVRRRLTNTGTTYDERWSSDVDTAKTAADAELTTALAAWSPVYSAAHTDADHAARYAESLQVTAQATTSSTPYVAAGSVLAPSSAIAVATDETPIASASRLLLDGASNALRLVARDLGVAGNRVEVKVENATSGSATKCKITVRLGTYSEVYDEIEGGGVISTSPDSGVDIGSSLLLASATWIASTRPDNLAYAALTGGTGGSFQAVTARIDRALLLEAAADHVTTLRAYRAALATSYAAKPTRETSGTDLYRRKGRVRSSAGLVTLYDRSVLELEDELTVLLAEAARLLATVAY